jgi:hypothetical protein
MDGVFQPSVRTASPFSPPPLTALSLSGMRSSASTSAQILSRALAEEIRLLLPPRLQLATDWQLVYSIEQDGVSLGTLYSKCNIHGDQKGGFVLVVKDGLGGTFGAFVTDAPRPAPHYTGTGEAFLWRASVLPASSILANLPPPPSTDTTNLARSTTVVATAKEGGKWGSGDRMRLPSSEWDVTRQQQIPSGTTTPDRMRFKAFPYSGVNDYVMFCEHDYLSVGGGDGRYGLWLDSNLERGVSSQCMTFGNEALSEEGDKFDVMGVEVWTVEHVLL